MKYSEQTKPPWKAFVPKGRPKPEGEWTREMDEVIADAIGCCPWIPIETCYANDLVAVVMATEKWCASTGKLWQLGNSFFDRKEYFARIGEEGPRFVAFTPALAMARALYANIVCEERTTK